MNIEMLFSAQAGQHERMLKRQYDNPLFGDVLIESFDVEEARKKDKQDVDVFINSFRDLVTQVTELDDNTDAELVLNLKESLDKCYENSAGLGGDQTEIQEMIKRLLVMMMQSMWKAVGNDAQGISKLEMEDQAREAHFALLEHPFIADLLSPESVIGEQHMLPSLLSESAEAVILAVQLFDPEQQQLMYKQGVELLQNLDESHPRVQTAKQRLDDIAMAMTATNQQPS